MKQILVNVDFAAATAKTIVLPVLDECRIVSVTVIPNAAPGAAKALVVKKIGGNTIFSGDLSGTAKTPAKLTKTATVADANQVITTADGIEVSTVGITNACNVSLMFKLDDHLISQM